MLPAMFVRSHMNGLVAVIEMVNPAKRNAMSIPMLEELLAALRTAAKDPDSKAAVLAGSDGVFSAGADVSEVVDAEGAVHRMQLFAAVYEAVTRFPKPLIAAISGPAVGGGAEVATGCDLRVGDETARFRFPGAAFGIPIGSARLPLLIGLGRAKDLLLTTRMVDAQEAYRLGLLDRLVDGDPVPAAVELATATAANPGAADQKRLLDKASRLSERTASENRGLVAWQRSAGRGISPKDS